MKTEEARDTAVLNEIETVETAVLFDAGNTLWRQGC